jgi:hypothetical protein
LNAVAELIRNAAESAGLVDREAKPTPTVLADANDRSLRHMPDGHANGHTALKANELHRQPVEQN